MLRERDGNRSPPALLDVDWMLFAACSELEVEDSDRLFFCGRGQARLANQARAICAGCEVQGECLEFALRNPEETEYGVWGGTMPGQRRRLRGRSR
jgi:WhiB family transcriptional regulator, redox-sensing transcriptional regulator